MIHSKFSDEPRHAENTTPFRFTYPRCKSACHAQTRQSDSRQTNPAYWDRKPPFDPLLKAPSEGAPLSPSGTAAHSFGTLYPTDRWSLVDRNSPDPAALVL